MLRARTNWQKGARLGAVALSVALSASASPAHAWQPLPPGNEAWTTLERGAIRGLTIGPIENSRHPGVGYGSPASARSMVEAARIGSTWVSLTPFGRVWDLKSRGIDLTFEAPFEQNRAAVLEAMRQAHREGLRVLLVPHLWVETGGWRALIDPGSDAAWEEWSASYERFLMTWAEVAREGEADMLSVGVELRSWVTTPRAPSMLRIIERVRAVYPGPLTYSANWDDVGDTMILDAIDLIGINAFYPLAKREGATREELEAGGVEVARSLEELSVRFQKPILLTEIGYTTRSDPAFKPWEWPDGMKDVHVDERAQAEAYRALVAPLLSARWCAGFFVWRVYADPDDVSQEAEWGFSPRGKLAELVVRDAFAAYWEADGDCGPGCRLGRSRARTPGFMAWELSPPITW